MFIVPSVTMKGGSLMRVTSSPLTRPKAVVAPMPSTMASSGCRPSSVTTLVITMEPSAITMPHDRSMPAVRMISVWPMASRPTTITCCRISEKFWPDRKLSAWMAKKALAASSASKGPSTAMGGRWRDQSFMSGTPLCEVEEASMVCKGGPGGSRPGCRKASEGGPHRLRPARHAEALLLAPAQVQTGLGVLAVHTRHWLAGDQGHARVGVAADLLARLRVLHAGFQAHRGHLQR